VGAVAPQSIRRGGIAPTIAQTVTRQAPFIRYCILTNWHYCSYRCYSGFREPDCPGQLFSSLTACRIDRGARVLSLATLWPCPKLSRPIQYSALETQKFGLFAWGTKTYR